MLSFRKKIATKGDFAVSTNVAYGEVNIEDTEAVYENLDEVVRSVDGKDELTEHPVAYEFPVSRPAAANRTKPSSKEQQQQQQHAGF